MIGGEQIQGVLLVRRRLYRTNGGVGVLRPRMGTSKIVNKRGEARSPLPSFRPGIDSVSHCYNEAMLVVRRLVWDPWNVAHIACHEVTPEEVEEVCHGEPVVQEGKHRRESKGACLFLA